VATLAVGLAGTTAVFSLVRSVLLHPLPYREPGRLVVMWQTDTRAGTPFVGRVPARAPRGAHRSHGLAAAGIGALVTRFRASVPRRAFRRAAL
jgi:hypothetical protein